MVEKVYRLFCRPERGVLYLVGREVNVVGGHIHCLVEEFPFVPMIFSSGQVCFSR